MGVVKTFAANGFETFSADFRESANASVSITLPSGGAQAAVDKVAEHLTNAKASLDVVVCAAGGWAGGDIKSKDILAGVDKMYQFNLQSAVASSHLATHHLISSLAESGLPQGSAVVGILPICLDTQTNREGMPTANFDDWTPLETVADLLLKWAKNEDRPATGALVKMTTKNKETKFETV